MGVGGKHGLWIQSNQDSNSGLPWARCFPEPQFLHLLKGDRIVAKVNETHVNTAYYNGWQRVKTSK